MAYWLFKSEPDAWSWESQKKKLPQGESLGESWNGVRNYQANNNMKAMRLGDLGFFYHSVTQKSIVGIVRVVREHYPDDTDETGRFGMVDVAAVCDVPNIVTLSDIKSNPDLADFALIKQSRLSVVPVSQEQWNIICGMGGVDMDNMLRTLRQAQ
jgi:predicted RNA-binding protein with PUA-like domain